METITIIMNYQELSYEAALMVARQILAQKNPVIGLPTGKTPIGMYKVLAQFYRKGLLDFSHIVTFNIDEYHGIPASSRYSYHQFMITHLFRYINVQAKNTHILDGSTDNALEECQRYEEKILQVGGIDLLVLGLGLNGHIGFNEPGTSWDTTTRLVTLSQETRQREAVHFDSLDLTPTQGLTMGIKTIMNAKRLMLLAFGEEKAKIVAASLKGPITKAVPASILRLHPSLTVILDKEAANLL